MPVDPNDYTQQAIVDRLEEAKQQYEDAGNPGGVAAAEEAIFRATTANSNEEARDIELQFNRGDFGPIGGDDFDQIPQVPVIPFNPDESKDPLKQNDPDNTTNQGVDETKPGGNVEDEMDGKNNSENETDNEEIEEGEVE